MRDKVCIGAGESPKIGVSLKNFLNKKLIKLIKESNFGASRNGRFTTNSGCDEVIVAFCDNDKKKHGKTINEIPVISPKELSNVSFDQVVIASEYVSEIFEQLKKLGLSNRQIALAPRPIHEVQTSKNDQNKFKTSETSKCRESLFAKEMV